MIYNKLAHFVNLSKLLIITKTLIIKLCFKYNKGSDCKWATD